MSELNNIIKISQENYQKLIDGGFIKTKDSIYKYDENDIYLVEDQSSDSNTLTSAEWGNISGNISDQIDLKLEFDTTVTTQSVETVSDVTLEISVNIPILDKSSDISTNSFAIDPNKMYYFGTRTTLTITFNTPTNNNIINEYMFLFTSGSTATTLNVPSSVKWIKDPDIQTNKKYGVSILDNLGVIGEWSNE